MKEEEMELVLLYDHRYQRQPDGSVRSATHYDYELLARRYGSVFGHVHVAARVDDGVTGRVALGPGIDVVSMGNWTGAFGYALARFRLGRQLQQLLVPGRAVIMIVPGMLGDLALPMLKARGMPYGVEVMGDAQDTLSRGSMRHPLRPLLQHMFEKSLHNVCRHAAAASYVTRQSLQRRYPAPPTAFTTHYSSIELRDSHFVAGPRTNFAEKKSWRAICVGSMASTRKGQDTLIRAAAQCRRAGIDLRLTLVGDGQHRTDFAALATELDIVEHVHFTGHLPAGDAVRAELDRADLYVLPSRGEGLPRSVIEAMARGLPCLATEVSGIPELLSPRHLFPPNDAAALARRMRDFLANAVAMAQASKDNLATAQEYHDNILSQRRQQFYEYLRDCVRDTACAKAA